VVEAAPLEAGKAELQVRINNYVATGYRVRGQSDTKALVEGPPKPPERHSRLWWFVTILAFTLSAGRIWPSGNSGRDLVALWVDKNDDVIESTSLWDITAGGFYFLHQPEPQ
jgi:hypothetical protein